MKYFFLLFFFIFSTMGCSQESVDTAILPEETIQNSQENTTFVSEKTEAIHTTLQEIASSEGKQIVLTSSFAEADIYYSTDPEVYDVSQFEKYEEPFTVRHDMVLRFYSLYEGQRENIQFYNIMVDFSVENLDASQTENIFRPEVLYSDAQTTFIRSYDVQPPSLEKNTFPRPETSDTFSPSIVQDQEGNVLIEYYTDTADQIENDQPTQEENVNTISDIIEEERGEENKNDLNNTLAE